MWAILVVIVILLLAVRHLSRSFDICAVCKRVRSVDGVALLDKVAKIPGKTILGNNIDVLNETPATVYKYFRDNVTFSKGKSYLLHFLLAPVYNVTRAEDAEEVLQSTGLITKHVMYDCLLPFLGEGLLTSTDKKWHFRRKLLTPAFHFNILQTFLEIFKEESGKFLEALSERDGKIATLAELVPQFTLNNVCETALGVKLDNVSGSKEYRAAIHSIERSIVKRVCNPLMYFEPIYRLFGDVQHQRKYLKIAHDFCSEIIAKRREGFRQRRQLESTATPPSEDADIGKRQRYAMLDTLLDAELKGQIDHQGICDEVNTFMFEGYDTTSTCLTFTLLSLGWNPEIQERCYREVAALAEMEHLTLFDFNQLDYLESVVKETLRLYATVPIMGRRCVKETRLNGMLFPEGSQINIHLVDVMRDPRHFPDPLVFNPDRFRPENTLNRHPFAFIPFSAGPRNCIGQKFAMLEMKVLLVAIIRNYRISPVTRPDEIVFENGLVLRTQQRVQVRFDRRRP